MDQNEERRSWNSPQDPGLDELSNGGGVSDTTKFSRDLMGHSRALSDTVVAMKEQRIVSS